MKTAVSQIFFIKRRDNTWIACKKAMNKLVEVAVIMNLKV